MLRESLLHRMDTQDRALYRRWVICSPASRAALLPWTLFTHLGGVTASVLFALVPLLVADGRWKVAAIQVARTLVLSLLVVQAVKRIAVRARPAERALAHVHVPDRFSFPSGHAAAAMSFAYIYAATFHSFAWILLALAVLVGVSRVRLGTHYPGDVLLGQIIAIMTGVAVRMFWPS